MASSTPDLRLPSQPQSITAPWPVPNYTAWWQRHMGVNNLPSVATQQCTDRELNPQPFVRESNALPLHYRVTLQYQLPVPATYCFSSSVISILLIQDGKGWVSHNYLVSGWVQLRKQFAPGKKFAPKKWVIENVGVTNSRRWFPGLRNLGSGTKISPKLS